MCVYVQVYLAGRVVKMAAVSGPVWADVSAGYFRRLTPYRKAIALGRSSMYRELHSEMRGTGVAHIDAAIDRGKFNHCVSAMTAQMAPKGEEIRIQAPMVRVCLVNYFAFWHAFFEYAVRMDTVDAALETFERLLDERGRWGLIFLNYPATMAILVKTRSLHSEWSTEAEDTIKVQKNPSEMKEGEKKELLAFLAYANTDDATVSEARKAVMDKATTAVMDEMSTSVYSWSQSAFRATIRPHLAYKCAVESKLNSDGKPPPSVIKIEGGYIFTPKAITKNTKELCNCSYLFSSLRLYYSPVHVLSTMFQDVPVRVPGALMVQQYHMLHELLVTYKGVLDNPKFLFGAEGERLYNTLVEAYQKPRSDADAIRMVCFYLCQYMVHPKLYNRLVEHAVRIHTGYGAESKREWPSVYASNPFQLPINMAAAADVLMVKGVPGTHTTTPHARGYMTTADTEHVIVSSSMNSQRALGVRDLMQKMQLPKKLSRDDVLACGGWMAPDLKAFRSDLTWMEQLKPQSPQSPIPIEDTFNMEDVKWDAKAVAHLTRYYMECTGKYYKKMIDNGNAQWTSASRFIVMRDAFLKSIEATPGQEETKGDNNPSFASRLSVAVRVARGGGGVMKEHTAVQAFGETYWRLRCYRWSLLSQLNLDLGQPIVDDFVLRCAERGIVPDTEKPEEPAPLRELGDLALTSAQREAERMRREAIAVDSEDEDEAETDDEGDTKKISEPDSDVKEIPEPEQLNRIQERCWVSLLVTDVVCKKLRANAEVSGDGEESGGDEKTERKTPIVIIENSEDDEESGDGYLRLYEPCIFFQTLMITLSQEAAIAGRRTRLLSSIVKLQKAHTGMFTERVAESATAGAAAYLALIRAKVITVGESPIQLRSRESEETRDRVPRLLEGSFKLFMADSKKGTARLDAHTLAHTGSLMVPLLGGPVNAGERKMAHLNAKRQSVLMLNDIYAHAMWDTLHPEWVKREKGETKSKTLKVKPRPTADGKGVMTCIASATKGQNGRNDVIMRTACQHILFLSRWGTDLTDLEAVTTGAEQDTRRPRWMLMIRRWLRWLISDSQTANSNRHTVALLALCAHILSPDAPEEKRLWEMLRSGRFCPHNEVTGYYQDPPGLLKTTHTVLRSEWDYIGTHGILGVWMLLRLRRIRDADKLTALPEWSLLDSVKINRSGMNFGWEAPMALLTLESTPDDAMRLYARVAFTEKDWEAHSTTERELPFSWHVFRRDLLLCWQNIDVFLDPIGPSKKASLCQVCPGLASVRLFHADTAWRDYYNASGAYEDTRGRTRLANALTFLAILWFHGNYPRYLGSDTKPEAPSIQEMIQKLLDGVFESKEADTATPLATITAIAKLPCDLLPPSNDQEKQWSGILENRNAAYEMVESKYAKARSYEDVELIDTKSFPLESPEDSADGEALDFFVRRESRYVIKAADEYMLYRAYGRPKDVSTPEGKFPALPADSGRRKTLPQAEKKKKNKEEEKRPKKKKKAKAVVVDPLVVAAATIRSHWAECVENPRGAAFSFAKLCPWPVGIPETAVIGDKAVTPEVMDACIAIAKGQPYIAGTSRQNVCVLTAHDVACLYDRRPLPDETVRKERLKNLAALANVRMDVDLVVPVEIVENNQAGVYRRPWFLLVWMRSSGADAVFEVYDPSYTQIEAGAVNDDHKRAAQWLWTCLTGPKEEKECKLHIKPNQREKPTPEMDAGLWTAAALTLRLYEKLDAGNMNFFRYELCNLRDQMTAVFKRCRNTKAKKPQPQEEEETTKKKPNKKKRSDVPNDETDDSPWTTKELESAAYVPKKGPGLGPRWAREFPAFVHGFEVPSMPTHQRHELKKLGHDRRRRWVRHNKSAIKLDAETDATPEKVVMETAAILERANKDYCPPNWEKFNPRAPPAAMSSTPPARGDESKKKKKKKKRKEEEESKTAAEQLTPLCRLDLIKAKKRYCKMIAALPATLLHRQDDSTMTAKTSRARAVDLFCYYMSGCKELKTELDASQLDVMGAQLAFLFRYLDEHPRFTIGWWTPVELQQLVWFTSQWTESMGSPGADLDEKLSFCQPRRKHKRDEEREAQTKAWGELKKACSSVDEAKMRDQLDKLVKSYITAHAPYLTRPGINAVDDSKPPVCAVPAADPVATPVVVLVASAAAAAPGSLVPSGSIAPAPFKRHMIADEQGDEGTQSKRPRVASLNEGALSPVAEARGSSASTTNSGRTIVDVTSDADEPYVDLYAPYRGLSPAEVLARSPAVAGHGKRPLPVSSGSSKAPQEKRPRTAPPAAASAAARKAAVARGASDEDAKISAATAAVGAMGSQLNFAANKKPASLTLTKGALVNIAEIYACFKQLPLSADARIASDLFDNSISGAEFRVVFDLLLDRSSHRAFVAHALTTRLKYVEALLHCVTVVYEELLCEEHLGPGDHDDDTVTTDEERRSFLATYASFAESKEAHDFRVYPLAVVRAAVYTLVDPKREAREKANFVHHSGLVAAAAEVIRVLVPRHEQRLSQRTAVPAKKKSHTAAAVQYTSDYANAVVTSVDAVFERFREIEIEMRTAGTRRIRPLFLMYTLVSQFFRPTADRKDVVEARPVHALDASTIATRMRMRLAFLYALPRAASEWKAYLTKHKSDHSALIGGLKYAEAVDRGCVADADDLMGMLDPITRVAACVCRPRKPEDMLRQLEERAESADETVEWFHAFQANEMDTMAVYRCADSTTDATPAVVNAQRQVQTITKLCDTLAGYRYRDLAQFSARVYPPRRMHVSRTETALDPVYGSDVLRRPPSANLHNGSCDWQIPGEREIGDEMVQLSLYIPEESKAEEKGSPEARLVHRVWQIRVAEAKTALHRLLADWNLDRMEHAAAALCRYMLNKPTPRRDWRFSDPNVHLEQLQCHLFHPLLSIAGVHAKITGLLSMTADEHAAFVTEIETAMRLRHVAFSDAIQKKVINGDTRRIIYASRSKERVIRKTELGHWKLALEASVRTCIDDAKRRKWEPREVWSIRDGLGTAAVVMQHIYEATRFDLLGANRSTGHEMDALLADVVGEMFLKPDDTKTASVSVRPPIDYTVVPRHDQEAQISFAQVDELLTAITPTWATVDKKQCDLLPGIRRHKFHAVLNSSTMKPVDPPIVAFGVTAEDHKRHYANGEVLAEVMMPRMLMNVVPVEFADACRRFLDELDPRVTSSVYERFKTASKNYDSNRTTQNECDMRCLGLLCVMVGIEDARCETMCFSTTPPGVKLEGKGEDDDGDATDDERAPVPPAAAAAAAATDNTSATSSQNDDDDADFVPSSQPISPPRPADPVSPLLSQVLVPATPPPLETSDNDDDYDDEATRQE
jgi:hypothetical protein